MVRGETLIVCGPDPNRLSTAIAIQFLPAMAKMDPPLRVVGSCCCWAFVVCVVRDNSKNGYILSSRIKVMCFMMEEDVDYPGTTVAKLTYFVLISVDMCVVERFD